MTAAPNQTVFFKVNEQQLDDLEKILEAPLRDTPKLAALLAKPSLFPSPAA